jgi:hypothetical protein
MLIVLVAFVILLTTVLTFNVHARELANDATFVSRNSSAYFIR